MKPSPLLTVPNPAAQKLKALRELFPSAIEADPQGHVRINGSALQLTSPCNSRPS